MKEKYNRTLDEELDKKIKSEIHEHEQARLADYASKNRDGKRREEKLKEHIRTRYSRDADRILHTHAYSRYIDKTQAFYLVDNDHITHRVLHVHFVSKIARTIGRALKLNEDLIQAIAIGHDIGHPPFGHIGEEILSNICKSQGIGRFVHNAQAVQFLDTIEDENLTLQVLDGIFCHDGEKLQQELRPNFDKSWETLDEQVEMVLKEETEFTPETMEGCVVRFADIIGYIGRDIRDAIEIGLIDDWSAIPESCERAFRDNYYDNIINTFAIDLIENSYGEEYVTYSEETFQLLKELREFNLNQIYRSKELRRGKEKIKRIYELLFTTFLEDLEEENTDSKIYEHFINLDWVDDEYLENASNAEKVRDYIAGMTDRYFMDTFKELTIPETVTDFKDEEET